MPLGCGFVIPTEGMLVAVGFEPARALLQKWSTTKKEQNTAANLELAFAPAGRFHGGSFGVSGTPPGA
jgi:hypothetical protein